MDLLDRAAHDQLAAQLISVANGHLEIPLTRLRGASLLWLNADEAMGDPMWGALGRDPEAYGRHLLDSCAYQVARGACSSDRTGIVDRYGGSGIGANGGSGRAVMMGPYYVKGVGPTPLIGIGAHPDHATGGAYLEECVRETVLAELLAAELPYGAVRTLAIIATGDVQIWSTENGPKPERCCLLIRRAFLRPAHIERAALYRGRERLPGMADANRVRCMIAALQGRVGGASALEEQLIVGFSRWARQLAGSYLQCLPHGGVSSSNVTIDGRLVDFGATAGVPSLAHYWVGGARNPSGQEVQDVVGTVHGVACALRFTAGRGDPIDAWRSKASREVLRAHQESLHAMLLHLLGFTLPEIRTLLSGSLAEAISLRLDRWLKIMQSRTWSVLEGTPWHLHSMPGMQVIEVLESEVRSIAIGCGATMPAPSSDEEKARRKRRSRWLAPRIRLDHDRLKDECYLRTEEGRRDDVGAEELRKVIDSLIQEIVVDESRIRLDSLSPLWAELPVLGIQNSAGWSHTWSFKLDQSGAGFSWSSGGVKQP